jgi:hypothetical protein
VVPLSILAVILAAAAVGFGALLGGKSKSGATAQSPASSQSSESMKQSPVSKWADKNKSKSDRLAKAMNATLDAEVSGSDPPSALRSACQELGDANRAAAGALPAPNAALTDALRVAFDAFGRAAQECITGVDSADPAARDRFRTDLQAGQQQIGVAGYMAQALSKAG